MTSNWFGFAQKKEKKTRRWRIGIIGDNILYIFIRSSLRSRLCVFYQIATMSSSSSVSLIISLSSSSLLLLTDIQQEESISVSVSLQRFPCGSGMAKFCTECRAIYGDIRFIFGSLISNTCSTISQTLVFKGSCIVAAWRQKTIIVLLLILAGCRWMWLMLMKMSHSNSHSPR